MNKLGLVMCMLSCVGSGVFYCWGGRCAMNLHTGSTLLLPLGMFVAGVVIGWVAGYVEGFAKGRASAWKEAAELADRTYDRTMEIIKGSR